MKLLVIGGTHGNELLGIQIVRLLQENPIKGVDTLIANPEAVRQKRRFIESDLNRSFGIQTDDTLETVRAKEVKQLTEAYDVVLDFHNTQTPNNNCAFVGIDCQPVLYDVIQTVGLDRCIEATYDCINKYCTNTVSIEVSIGDPLDDPRVWYEKIVALADGSTVGVRNELSVYQFRRRVTWDEKDLMNLRDWRPFARLNDVDKNKLSITGEIVPIFIGSKLTEYYATLLEKTGAIL